MEGTSEPRGEEEEERVSSSLGGVVLVSWAALSINTGSEQSVQNSYI